MADSERLPTPHVCERCKAIDDAVPTEAALKVLVSEDWDLEGLAFMPRPMNQSQAVASELLTSALAKYWAAFGTECTGARLNSLLLVLRDRARTGRVMGRIREARADINARARAEREYGREAEAQAIEQEPTPDYPQKARDEAWMQGVGR